MGRAAGPREGLCSTRLTVHPHDAAIALREPLYVPRSDEVKDRRAGVLPPASLSCLLHGAIARFGTVEEIAHTALFLAAPESGFITGITLSVDGGAVAAGAYMVEKYRRRKAGFAAPPPTEG